MSTGVTEQVPKDEERYIRFTNLEAVFTVFGAAFYVVYSLYAGNYLLSLCQGAVTIGALMALLLNHKAHYKAARMIFLLSVNSVILVNACFIGHQSGVHEFYYISYTIPFLLFNVRDYKYIITGVAMAVLGFNVYQHIYPYFTAYNFDAATQAIVFQINTWTIFVLFGSAVYVLTYFNYQTEKKLESAAEQLANANKEMEKSNMQLEAINKKLELQAVELKRSNEDLEQFGYIISHDLKAPVRNISSFMNLLMKQYGEGTPKGTRELVEMSKQSSDRLIRQIDDMLSYCRVDRNLPPVAPVDINHMVQTIKMELNPKIKEVNAEVTVEGDLPVIGEVHSTMLHHVFQNLIANGIKFNTNEKPEVKISCKREGDLLTFSVADNGIGIDAAYKSKLFQMFKRLHSVDQFEGTGIGLAVCKKIVNFYQGEIWFEGEIGKGTTFFFTLTKPVVQLPQIKAAEQLDAIKKAA